LDGTFYDKSSASPWQQNVPLTLALFLYSYEAEFIQKLIKDK